MNAKDIDNPLDLIPADAMAAVVYRFATPPRRVTFTYGSGVKRHC